MGTTFMNSKNSKISDFHRVLFNLSGKIDVKKKNEYFALSNLRISCTWKNVKKITQEQNI